MRTVLLASLVASLFASFSALAQGETAPATEPTPSPAPAATPPVTPPADPEIREVDGWKIVSFTSGKRLPDGRDTMERCGWVRDVVVEKIIQGKPTIKRGVLNVPCEKDLSPGKPTLTFPDDKKEEPPRPPVTFDDAAGLAVLGRYDEKALQAELSSRLQQMNACVKESGKITLRFVVDGKGSVTDAGILEGPLKGTETDACLASKAKAWTFAAPADGHDVVVSLPLVLTKASATTAGAAPATTAKAAVQRPCAQGEKPLPKEQLKEGQLPCVEHDSERGVPFLKGELTRFGDVQLTNVKNSIGVGIGLATLDNAFFLQLRPDLNLHYGPFSLGLGAPLRFEIADLSGINLSDPDSTSTIFAEAGRFRTEDWDQIEDFLRPIRYVTWGKKEQRLYVDVNRVHSVTLGHGQLVRRYTPNVDIDEDNLFAAADGYTDVGGVELIAGPFPVPRIAGGLVFVKPFGAFSEDTIAKSFSIGLTYVTDLNAPTVLEKRANPADGRAQLAVDETNQLVFFGRENPIGNQVQGVGLDSEVKVLKLDFIDIKLYGDYSQLFFPEDRTAAQAFSAFSAGGATVGSLFRLSFGETPVRPIEDETEDVKKGRAPREMKAGHALRARIEARAFDARYLPSYFNTLYEIDRLQYGVTDRNLRATLPTKIGFLAAHDGEPLRAGFYTELSYAWVDVIGITAVYEDAYALGNAALPVGGRNFALHAETSGFGYLQLFASYHYRNFEDFGGLFTFNTDNEILFAGGRIEVLPILFLNLAVQRQFRVGFDDDDISRQVDEKGLRFTSIGFENVWGGSFDVELGWQF